MRIRYRHGEQEDIAKVFSDDRSRMSRRLSRGRRVPKLETRNPKFETNAPKLETRNPKFETNSKLEIRTGAVEVV